jgi:hypothetical protein
VADASVIPAAEADASVSEAGAEADASTDAEASSEPPPRFPFHEPMPGPGLAKDAPSVRYANLSAAGCRAELKKQGLDAKPTKVAPKTILLPMRIHGPFHEVRFVTAPAKSPYGIADCRLVLTLGELAGVLASFGVVSVRVDNLYRPRARLPGSPKRSQHAYGLAADITSFQLADGRVLSAEDDWHASIGDKACGPEAVMNDPDEESILLRNLVCEVARRGIFHHMLTPGFNAAHRTHFHFDVQRGQKRWAIH